MFNGDRIAKILVSSIIRVIHTSSSEAVTSKFGTISVRSAFCLFLYLWGLLL